LASSPARLSGSPELGRGGFFIVNATLVKQAMIPAGTEGSAPTQRLEAFSDGVFIVAIMVFAQAAYRVK